MKTAMWVVGLAIALWGIDRILVWCELRGWITYRLTPRVRHGAGNVLLGLEVFFRPERQHVVELRQDADVYREEDDDGDRPPQDGDATVSRPSSPRARRAEREHPRPR